MAFRPTIARPCLRLARRLCSLIGTRRALQGSDDRWWVEVGSVCCAKAEGILLDAAPKFSSFKAVYLGTRLLVD